MQKFFFIFVLLATIQAKAQDCGLCGDHTLVNFQKIEWLGIEKPDDSVLLNEYDKLEDLWWIVLRRCEDFFPKGNCIELSPTFRNSEGGGGAKTNKYSMYGTIIHVSNEYVLRLFIRPACSEEEIGSAEIRFQMYPFFDLDKIATEAAHKIVPELLNIYEFERKRRASGNYGLGGDLSGGQIQINFSKKMVKGEEKRIVLTLMDCDEEPLRNRVISTAGTTGGFFTPATFKTDDEGKAIAKFKMTTDKVAILKASSEVKNVWGCDDLYTGTAVVTAIEGTPVKVSINYQQNETKALKRATLPGVQIKGGEKTEVVTMKHRSVLYYFPSKTDLEQGFLVNVEKQGYYIGMSNEPPSTDGKAIFATESGVYTYTKSVQSARISGMVGNVEMVRGEEDGEDRHVIASASLGSPSEVMFFLGSQNEPPSFMWSVEYPATDGNSGGGAATIVKGDSTVKWEVNRITDANSIYKTEYVLSLTLYAAEELKKGDQAMKELFGFKLDELARAIDPTKPAGKTENMAFASGSQSIDVRILSPYEDSSLKRKK